jgi:hypothetical protein
MKYDFVEIGTSDFDSCSQKNITTSGLCVEPLKYYLDRLPSRPNLYKENCAISNFEGEIEIYYCSEEVINKYKLPWFIRGCNKVGDFHPTVLKELNSRKLSKDLITIDKVKVKTYSNLMREYDCRSIEFLKIDTEGHDNIIIESFSNFYDNDESHGFELPKKIKFETYVGILSTKQQVDKSKKILEKFGYKLEQETRSDIIYKL